MSYGTGRYVWRMPPELAVALVATFDVFATLCMFITYLLRGEGKWRFVASLAFMFALGAQLAAAEIFGAYKHWPFEIRLMSVLPSLFLAVSLELVVIWRLRRGVAADQVETDPRPSWWARRRAARALAEAMEVDRKAERARPILVTIKPRVALAAAHAAVLAADPPPAVESAVTRAARPLTGEEPVLIAPERGVGKRRTPARRRGSPTGRQRDPRWGDVIKRCLDAEPREEVKPVAIELGVNPRTAQLWVARERATRAAGPRP